MPQVYGLGDLTSIVDERLSEQSRALLDSWIPKLRTYVPTKAHRDAVNAISEHEVVLLLGNPSSGKSAIGAIISTIASENPDSAVLALTEVMRHKPHMMAALIRGAPIDLILGSFTCEGSLPIRDALVIPTALDDALVVRLGHTPDEYYLNRIPFHFLHYRASEVAFTKVVQQYPDLLQRSSWQTDPAVDDPKLAAFGRANRLGILHDDLRQEAADRLETAVQDGLDASFFEEEDMLGLLSPLRLVSMGMGLWTTSLPSLEDRIDEITADADLDDEPDSHFKKLLDLLDRVEAIGVDVAGAALIEEARDQVGRSVDEIEERKRGRDEEDESDADWTHIVTQKKEDAPVRLMPAATRSTFDDIDK